MLKAYQIKSCASTITKEEFPRLLDELYEKSFLPQHFRSGFRKCGLYPLCREAISLSKLSKALPYSKPSKPEVNNSSIEPEVVLDFKGTVTVAKTTTPIRFQLRGYFAQLLQAKEPGSKSTDKWKVKPKFYGEALTTDDVFQRFEEEETRKEEEKKARALRKEIRAQRTTTYDRAHGKGKAKAKLPRKQAKQRRKKEIPVINHDSDPSCSDTSEEDNGVCEECGGIYTDDNQRAKEKWMGFDTCDRWYHFDCLGYSSIPTGVWSCDQCYN